MAITLPHAIFLYDESGNPVPVVSGSTINVGSRGFIVYGKSGSVTQHFTVDSDGKLAIQNQPNMDVAISTRLSSEIFTSSVGQVTATPTPNTLLGRLKDIRDEIVARIGSLGQKTMSGSTPVVIASNQSDINVVIKDQNGINLAVQNDTTIPQNTKGILVLGVDTNGTAQRIALTEDGRLITSTAVQSPPNRVTVNVTAKSSITSTTGVDDEYIIPSGSSVTIQQLSAGAESNTAGSRVELYYSATAAKTGMTLVSVLYVNGSSATEPISYESPFGDGINNRIVLRRVRSSNSSAEVFGRWSGYY